MTSLAERERVCLIRDIANTFLMGEQCPFLLSMRFLFNNGLVHLYLFFQSSVSLGICRACSQKPCLALGTCAQTQDRALYVKSCITAHSGKFTQLRWLRRYPAHRVRPYHKTSDSTKSAEVGKPSMRDRPHKNSFWKRKPAWAWRTRRENPSELESCLTLCIHVVLEMALRRCAVDHMWEDFICCLLNI